MLGLGTLTLKSARRRRELPFAAIPLLFAIQQLSEGVIWLTFSHEAPLLNTGMTHVYSFFSHVLWPVYAPIALFIGGVNIQTLEQIEAVAGKTEVYAPAPEPRARKDAKKDEQGNAVQPDKHRPRPDDSDAVARWRVRMASEEAKDIYKQRAATAECVNAQARNRGLLRMPVRGLAKV